MPSERQIRDAQGIVAVQGSRLDGFVKSPSVPPWRDCASSLVIATY